MPHDLKARQVMDMAAALLNDTEKQVFTYAVQLPYLKMALSELKEQLQLSNIPITNETSTVIQINAGVSVISFITTPSLPSDLVEIQEVWERTRNSGPFSPVIRKEFLPHNLDDQQLGNLRYWTWNGQELRFIPSNTDRDIKIDYIQDLFADILDENSTIGMINAESFLHYRTAALCSNFIGANKTRSDELNSFAAMALERLVGIGVKTRQSILTRRRPFRSAYKRRGLL